MADNAFEIESENAVNETETPEKWNVRAEPNVPRLIQPIWILQYIVEMV
jgi:hypothetical protein